MSDGQRLRLRLRLRLPQTRRSSQGGKSVMSAMH